MANRDHLMTVANQIADYMNAFNLAFKTYNVSQLDDMMKSVAGEGQRISGDATSKDFKNIMLERGLTIFPAIPDTEDGYIRVIRSASLLNRLLNALRYPGANGDAELARLLRTLRSRRQVDDLSDEAE